MGEIRVLPPALVSRIAAGECIERPASVVKELVENALDAGASQVDIALEDGGRQLIQVRDDGAGMDAADLALSVIQHATSKLRSDEDLFNVHTLGFRGEALASIGSIARLRIVSRRPDDEIGHEIVVEGGQAREPRPCQAPPGTSVEVRDLFYAVPARRKFLRTNQTEMGHVTEQLARIALAQPGVGFSLRHGDRVTHRLPATSDSRQRISDFYGPELADVLLPLRRDSREVAIDGLIAPPAESRGSGKWEYIFVNGRHVRDRFVSHAVKEAYRSLIDPSRFPVVFLFLTVDPAAVDVNVHPTKSEVRWRDSNFVHGQVLSALRELFLSKRLDHRLKTPADDESYRQSVRAAMVDFFTHAPRGGVPPADPTAWSPGQRAAVAAPPTTPPATALRQTEAPALASPQPTTSVAPAALFAPPVPGEMPAETASLLPPAATEPVGAIQIHNTYLVVQTDEGLMIVDQHALHERILYEELRRRMTEGRLESQRLLLAEVVRVPADRLEALETHAETLGRLGLELAPAGPQAVAVHALPSLLLERIDLVPFVRDLLDLLAEGGTRTGPETLIHDVLDMLACKAAVKAGDPLSADQIEALLARRVLAERSSHCPHGRPTTLRLTLRDLERQFHRR